MTDRIRGILVWVVSVGAIVGGLWALIASDLDEIEALEQQYLRRSALLARLNALPSEEEAIRAELEQLTIAASQRFLFDGEINEIQSEIQLAMRDLAAPAQLKIQSMRPISLPRQIPPLAATAVEVNMTGTHDALIDLLQRMESSEPLLRVHEMSLSVRRPSTPATAAELAMRLQVRGYKRLEGRRPQR